MEERKRQQSWAIWAKILLTSGSKTLCSVDSCALWSASVFSSVALPITTGMFSAGGILVNGNRPLSPQWHSLVFSWLLSPSAKNCWQSAVSQMVVLDSRCPGWLNIWTIMWMHFLLASVSLPLKEEARVRHQACEGFGGGRAAVLAKHGSQCPSVLAWSNACW